LPLPEGPTVSLKDPFIRVKLLVSINECTMNAEAVYL